jgi:hypothetical protein
MSPSLVLLVARIHHVDSIRTSQPATGIGWSRDRVRSWPPSVSFLKTSHAVKLSSGGFLSLGARRWEGDVFVVGLVGVEAVVQAAEQAVEQVALGCGVSVAGVAAPVVVGSGAG